MSKFTDKLTKAEDTYTFDDFLIKPGLSSIEPKDVKLNTKVSTNYDLNIPVVSSAMDTVTESEMAISLARQGGLGVIHRNLTIEQEVKEVKKVKFANELTVKEVITISPDETVADAQDIMDIEGVSGLPVVNEDNVVVGIISRRDIKPLRGKRMNCKVKEAMTHNVLTIAEGTDTDTALDIAYENKVERLPVVSENNELVGIVTMKDILERKKFPNAVRDDKGRYLVAAACGPFDIDRAMALSDAGADIIAIDSAHGHKTDIIESVREMNKNVESDILLGNIATAKAAEDILKAEINGIKVGIGPGSICTTRIVAGVGVPQLSAVSSVADVASDYDVPVIADGGLRYSGDVAKALAVGANAVMVGSLLAGTTESPGEMTIRNGRKYKQYRGMGSLGAMTGGVGAGKDRYFQGSGSNMNSTKLVPEGIEGVVPYKGEASQIVYQLMGGLKSSMGYVGAASIKEMHEKAELVHITPNGMSESHPHDITITNESPNYHPRE
ncbi:MAG: IMP dehydrogenase [Methanosphaera sp.]|uniref:IMP dehydrogenase n=1 Tax=Methanosphaera sp. TaxID=2666342 RepID=UPI002E7A05EC|nr:IMP dehydrogenase [Methanosphaera sp.]MEE1116973.1 IMP dehydrogenase [Methanosphaera sp.]MEE3324413.1 IMP dehydrogenase [Methanosphaera sp.]MEE3418105.1 IMP dehydrogenase [Methanosphaera sp.]